jgi:hypothetical protein
MLNSLKNTKWTLSVPPPQCPHVEPRIKTQKNPNLNSPKVILFAIQRKFLKFLQNIFPHLVTLFPVCLRVFPFSEISSKKQKPKSNPNFVQLTVILALSRSPS